jgi:aryl-alcohol dehydrogenase-like predicted oxidoreductase
MLYRTLGRTGIKVSPYALGALALGTPIGNPDHGYSVGIIRKALQENGRHRATGAAQRPAEKSR